MQAIDCVCGSSICQAKVNHPEPPRLEEDRLSDFMLQRELLGEMSVQFDLREGERTKVVGTPSTHPGMPGRDPLVWDPAAKTKPKPKIAGRAESLRCRGWTRG